MATQKTQAEEYPASQHTPEGPLPNDETSLSLTKQPPVITIMHASVGSGHKAAAQAIAQAVEALRGTHGVPADVHIDVLDILDFGRVHFDAIKLRLHLRAPRDPSMTSRGATRSPDVFYGVAAPAGRASCSRASTTMC